MSATTFLVSMSGGKVVIRRGDGKQATVKGTWVETDGVDCWPGSTRKAMHIENAVWE